MSIASSSSAMTGNFPVVGIGASAGGIAAMEALFKGVASDCGMAFVVVTHLSPDRESLLHEVVGRYTDMAVKVAEDGVAVAPNTVFVLGENAALTIEQGRLRLSPADALHRERKPIDAFFSALAQDQGERAVGIVLSGGDSDGTLGVKAIKEYGGLTLAQIPDGSGPRNPDMPRSAIASGFVDIAVTAEDMGRKLMAFAHSFDAIDVVPNNEKDAENELKQARESIHGLIKSHTGHDFSGYKAKTFMRRVKRRMQIAQVTEVDDYIALLKRDSTEVINLFRDLLINVTNFFRDPDSFRELEEKVLPKLFHGRDAGDTIRIWVAGCSTGEEVYSIAILMAEQLEKLPAPGPRVQIFATDIDEPALEVARAARYPAPLLSGVSDERRQSFFQSDGSSFVLRKDVREMCIFSPHSITRDPPFSRMDLVTCRNLLIYLSPEAQDLVIPAFHYSLRPGGFLFLGSSESLSQHADLFVTIDKKRRIFQAREHVTRIGRLPAFHGGTDTRSPGAGFSGTGDGRTTGYALRQSVEARVLERHAPPHVVVNNDGDVVYYSAKTGHLLEAPQGAPTRQILSMVRRSLRMDLRAALREVTETRQLAARDNIAVEYGDGRSQIMRISVEPFDDTSTREPLLLILFEPQSPIRNPGEIAAECGRRPDDTAELERELRETRDRLQSTIEEYETALEELKSSNEELVSVNEEAQSTNEELEASKEEMQSLNEELNTINAELNSKVEELDRANADLKNLFSSTQIATVFLDRNLRVRNYTPAVSSFFSLLPSDIGRPLTDLSNNLDYPELQTDIRMVFDTGEIREHHLSHDAEGKKYLVRLIPYRDADENIRGVVVTFIDVTRLAKAEEQQRVLVAELNHRVKNMLAVVVSIANQTRATTLSPDEFNDAFVGRLHAMARTFDLLSRRKWQEASVRDLVTQEIEPFGLERAILHGCDDVSLPPQQGLAVGMVLHELATNASKFGALSTNDGRVFVTWSVEGDTFRLDWREQDGPPVEEPGQVNFGLKLIRGEIEYKLNGEVETNFHTDGLKVRLSFLHSP
ncbi:CheR family methyltransferase [Fodinicurvata sp. EGI_FJ10296]|uniref:CheR family methyltransferase n=1 Tax=Fodinicurvata sp. EGI_FJ10296 TaxID=3231908 RepID=UPI0034520C98